MRLTNFTYFIQILCTDHPEHFKWVETRTNKVLDVGQKNHLFEGGFEKNSTTYIGRAWSFDELTVGKVICFPTICKSLTTIEQGKDHTHGKFEVLTYEPDGKAETTSETPIETRTETTFYEPLQEMRRSVSPGWYVFLVIGTAILIVTMIILVRRC